MSPVPSGAAISTPICEMFVGAAPPPFTRTDAQLVARTTIAAVDIGTAAIGRTENGAGTSVAAFIRLTGPTPTASVHCEKSTENPRLEASARAAGDRKAKEARLTAHANDFTDMSPSQQSTCKRITYSRRQERGRQHTPQRHQMLT